MPTRGGPARGYLGRDVAVWGAQWGGGQWPVWHGKGCSAVPGVGRRALSEAPGAAGREGLRSGVTAS